MPVAFDSFVFKLFDINAAPFIIVLDDQGIVRAITDRLQTGIILRK